MNVFVGLSGGVDSAVSAARLIDAGHTVVGVFIKVWHPDFLVCNWEAERLDAMRVAAHLNIPFLTCDAEARYRDEVAAYFIREYGAGRTPNPDVLCNRAVKFGAFLEFALAHGADAIATGHYAQVQSGKTGKELFRGADPAKDQSYFLWGLSREQLNAALFPIGNTTKTEVRKEAQERGLPVAKKQDSQGVCFLGHVDIKEFLSHYHPLTPGAVLDETGAVIGSHEGAIVYTIGQRHGFTLTVAKTGTAPQYVTAKNIDNNTITVSPHLPRSTPQNTITLRDCIIRSQLQVGATVEFQNRYHGAVTKATITELDGTTTVLTPHSDCDTPASGQSCVLYEDQHCHGGGIIV